MVEPTCVYQLNKHLTFRLNVIHIQYEMHMKVRFYSLNQCLPFETIPRPISCSRNYTVCSVFGAGETGPQRRAAPVAVPQQSLRLLYQLSEWHWTALRVNGLDRPLLVGGTALLTGYRFGSPSNRAISATYISLRWDISVSLCLRRVSSIELIWNRLLKLKLWILICTHDTHD